MLHVWNEAMNSLHHCAEHGGAGLDKTIAPMRFMNVSGVHWQDQGASLPPASSRAPALMAERA